MGIATTIARLLRQLAAALGGAEEAEEPGIVVGGLHPASPEQLPTYPPRSEAPPVERRVIHFNPKPRTDNGGSLIAPQGACNAAKPAASYNAPAAERRVIHFNPRSKATNDGTPAPAPKAYSDGTFGAPPEIPEMPPLADWHPGALPADEAEDPAMRVAGKAGTPDAFEQAIARGDFETALMDIRHLYRLLYKWVYTRDKGMYKNDLGGMAAVLAQDGRKPLDEADGDWYDTIRKDGDEFFRLAARMAVASRNVQDISEALLWRLGCLSRALTGRGIDF